jgi:uncharacterized protein (UPF0262 family)
MKDKQTKRIEALDRIRRTLANLESTRTVLRSRLDVKIKASDGKPRTLADVRVAIILSSELLACRSHLEMVEKHILRTS